MAESCETIERAPKNRKASLSDSEFTRYIILSVIGIVLCFACLFGLTWSWFSSSVGSATNKMTAAYFDLDITVKNDDTPVVGSNSGHYELIPTKLYKVEIKRTSDSTSQSGFCHISVVKLGSEAATVYYTDNMPLSTQGDTTYTYSFTVTGVSEITFTPMWGAYSEATEANTVDNGGKIYFSVSAIQLSTPKQTIPELETVPTEPTVPEEGTTEVNEPTPGTDEQNSEPTESPETEETDEKVEPTEQTEENPEEPTEQTEEQTEDQTEGQPAQTEEQPQNTAEPTQTDESGDEPDSDAQIPCEDQQPAETPEISGSQGE